MWQVIKEMKYVLSRKQKVQCIFVLIAILIGTCFELLGITAILPFITLVLSPEIIMEVEFVQSICNYMGITEVKDVITIFSVALIAIFLIKNSYLTFSRYVELKFGTSVRRELSTKILKSYMDSEYSFHLKHNSAVLMRGVGNDVSGTYLILGELFRMIADILVMLGISIFLLISDPFIAFFLISVTMICMLWFLFFFRKKVKAMGEENNVTVVKVSKYSMQALQGIKDILVMQRKKYFMGNYIDAVAKNANTACKYNIITSLPNRVFETLSVVGIIGSMSILNIRGVDLAEILPLLAVFAVGAIRILPAAGRLSVSINTIIYQRVTLSNTYYTMREIVKKDIMNDKKRLDNNSEEEINEKKPLMEAIRIHKISWRYSEDGVDVLKDLSLTIPKGKSIALIGESGAGKTTLADIILGLLKPQQGSVYADDMDIFDNKKAWAQMVGYVPQAVYLTDDTIRNNIAFGIEPNEIDDDKIWKALEQAQLANFVKGLKEGINMLVGERGVRFSGGQRQRIAIARALYHDPDILVLDEATSALDNETEKAVIESIDSLLGKKTMIIVAHRLSTVANCDEIYEIKGGIAVKRNKDEVLKTDIKN